MGEVKNLREYAKYTQNPFVDGLVIKKRDKTISFSRGLIIKDNETGEEQQTHMIHVRKKIDSEPFTKMFHETLQALLGISGSSIKIYVYIMKHLPINGGEIFFDFDHCKMITGYKSAETIYHALAELVENNMIARTRFFNKYYINPEFIFNGDRLVIVNDFTRAKSNDDNKWPVISKELTEDPEQPALPQAHNDWD